MHSAKVRYLLTRSYSSKNIYCFHAHGTINSFRTCQTAASTETVVIRIPKYMQNQVENVKQVRGVNKITTIKAGKLLIQSKNPQLNQSASYTLGKFELPVLSSKGWKHNKSFGDYFTINNTQHVPPFVTESQLEETEKQKKKSMTFHNLHLCRELVEALSSVNLTHPTTVQLQTIPKIMKGHNVLCAAETGSGKTLSYLLPILHKLYSEKESEELIDTAPKIRSVVLVPARELADQVSTVAKTLCAPLGLLVLSLIHI